MHAFCLFLLLSTVQQVRVSWALSVRKAAPWRYSFFQKFGKGTLYCWHSYRKLQYKDFSVVRSMSLEVIMKARQLESLTDCSDKIITPKFVVEIQVMMENNPSKLIRSITTNILWRCPWCNGYRRRKWTRRHEFKTWTRLIAFHIALIPLGKVWIQLFSPPLAMGKIVGQTGFFSLGEATSLGEGKLWIQTC